MSTTKRTRQGLHPTIPEVLARIGAVLGELPSDEARDRVLRAAAILCGVKYERRPMGDAETIATLRERLAKAEAHVLELEGEERSRELVTALLRRLCVVLKGGLGDADTMYSWHDLPNVAERLHQRAEAAEAKLEKAREALEWIAAGKAILVRPNEYARHALADIREEGPKRCGCTCARDGRDRACTCDCHDEVTP